MTLVVAKLKKIQLRRGFEAEDASLRRLNKCQLILFLNKTGNSSRTSSGWHKGTLLLCFFCSS